ncbi:TonB-dependent receptor [Hymenobacter sp. BT730]|uniref:TonB-dependent receptor n=1 Tax=Hymenobacter sp. BT730 TaxID=3063332 RepID=UPI0026DF1755|nr:TonB-dependent receptor [Hymenobacter sp. BT730]
MRTGAFHILWLVLAAWALPLPASAQLPAGVEPTDTARLLPAVRVEATRPERFAVGSRLQVQDSAALAQYRGQTLAEALGAQTAIYLKNYGPGQLASMTMRGTSARHTAVLWNGLNINLPTLGEADFALLPTTGATQVTVQHGPAGATYGTGAMGGTVLLASPVRWGAGLQASAQLDYGSYSLWAPSVEGSFSNQQVAVRVAGSARTARNDFPYNSPELQGMVSRRQQNADFTQWSLSNDITLRTGQRGEVMMAAWLTDTDRAIQPAIGAGNNHARERDQSRRILTGYRHIAARQESVVRVAWFEDILNYQATGISSKSRVRTAQLQGQHTITIAPRASIQVGAEVQHFGAVVDGYARPVEENRFSAFTLVRYDPHSRLHLTANLRQAVLPGRKSPLAPTLGTEWQAGVWTHQQLTVKASASRSYRAPTLNERYWRPGGNPNLLPEQGFGYEGGLQHTWQLAPRLRVQSEVTVYRQVIDNWVQWLPAADGGYYAPRNLRTVRVWGQEASTQLTWKTTQYRLQAQAAYAYTRSEKVRGYADDVDPTYRQLPYVPQHTVVLTTSQNWRAWQLGTTTTFTGFRYTDSGSQEFLPSYFLLNTSLGYTLRAQQNWSLTLLAQGYNLTNTHYRSYAAQAMPPHNGQLSLRVAWR